MPITPGSFTQLPPNSTGPKLGTGPTYTENANVVQDEKVILGEQYLAGYILNMGPNAVSTATVNAHLIQIMAGATLRLRIRLIEMYQVSPATTAGLAALSLVRLSTAGTGGTVLTPALLDPADAASGATGMTLPTVKGTESATVWSGEALFIQTIGASTLVNEPVMRIDFDRLHQKPLIIASGATNGLAVKILNGTAGATVLINVWFDEIAWA